MGANIIDEVFDKIYQRYLNQKELKRISTLISGGGAFLPLQSENFTPEEIKVAKEYQKEIAVRISKELTAHSVQHSKVEFGEHQWGFQGFRIKQIPIV